MGNQAPKAKTDAEIQEEADKNAAMMEEWDNERFESRLAHFPYPLPVIVEPGTECEYCRHHDEYVREAIADGRWNRSLEEIFEHRHEKVSASDVPWAPVPPVTEGVAWQSSRTRYWWDGKGENPNRWVALCPDCAEEHHSHWDDMWSNVSM